MRQHVERLSACSGKELKLELLPCHEVIENWGDGRGREALRLELEKCLERIDCEERQARLRVQLQVFSQLCLANCV